jgi:predicted esterase
MNRNYFRSIYFREPGGIVFEIATDGPGFATDETRETLGSGLVLPEWLDKRRDKITASLPRLTLPGKPGSRAAFLHGTGFIHIFERGAGPDEPVLLLLHGTGGDEHDLVLLARDVAPGFNILSPRGKVLENGMNRFFKRHSEGVFDEEDVKFRAGELTDFIAKARQAYNLNTKIYALGFSNGANMAAAVLFLHPEALDGAVLLRPMPPLSETATAGLSGKPVYIGAGESDTIIPPAQAERLRDVLHASGADVTFASHKAGHSLVPEELPEIRQWIDAKF